MPRPNGRRLTGRARLLAVTLTAALLAVLGTALLRPAASGTTAGASAPASVTIDSFNATVTNGASQNDLYLFLAGRAGRVVTVSVQAKSPAKAVGSGNPRSFTLSSGCSGTKPPANCPAVLSITGTTYVLYDVGSPTATTTSYANGVYTITGHFAVGQPTLNGSGGATIVLRALPLGTPGGAEADE